MYQKITFFSLIIGLILLCQGCNKTTSQKLAKHWDGKWMIIGVENGIENDYSEDNPYGYFEFFDDCSGVFSTPDGSQDFVIYPEKGVHLKLLFLHGEMVTYLVDRGFFNARKTAILEGDNLTFTIKKE